MWSLMSGPSWWRLTCLRLVGAVTEDASVQDDSIPDEHAESGAVGGSPEQRLQDVAGKDRGAEPGGEVPEAIGIAGTERMEKDPPGEPVRAQPVQDWAGHPGRPRKPGIRVQGVPVAAEPVQESLVGPGLLADHVVGSRGLVPGDRWRRSAPEPARTPRDYRTGRLGQHDAGLDLAQHVGVLDDRVATGVVDRGHCSRGPDVLGAR